MMTPEEARKAWVEALRSGEYKQGKGNLHVGDRYCCLGVACVVAVKDGLDITVEKPNEFDAVAYDDNDGLMPASVMAWLGLRSEDGSYKARNGKASDLAKRNDKGASFNRIADIIESAPKGLFVDGTDASD